LGRGKLGTLVPSPHDFRARLAFGLHFLESDLRICKFTEGSASGPAPGWCRGRVHFHPHCHGLPSVRALAFGFLLSLQGNAFLERQRRPAG